MRAKDRLPAEAPRKIRYSLRASVRRRAGRDQQEEYRRERVDVRRAERKRAKEVEMQALLNSAVRIHRVRDQ